MPVRLAAAPLAAGLLLVSALALAACDRADRDPERAVEPGAAGTPRTDERTGGRTVAGEESGAGGHAGEIVRRYEVQASSYALLPANFDVAPGTLRFVVHNLADEEHGLRVEGHVMQARIRVAATPPGLPERPEVHPEEEQPGDERPQDQQP